MNLKVTKAGRVSVLVLKGDLDTAAAPLVRETVSDLLGKGQSRLVVDLAGVPYIDSTGLGELVRAMKHARAAGGDVRLCGLRGDVLKIFEMTRLDKAMRIYRTRRAAASWK